MKYRAHFREAVRQCKVAEVTLSQDRTVTLDSGVIVPLENVRWLEPMTLEAEHIVSKEDAAGAAAAKVAWAMAEAAESPKKPQPYHHQGKRR